MGNMGGAGAARTMTQSLDKKRSCSTMHLTCFTMGTPPLSFTILAAHSKPLNLCSVMLRMISLMAAMHLWELCTEVKGDSLGGERSNLLLFVLLLLVVLVDVTVVVVMVDVLVVVVL